MRCGHLALLRPSWNGLGWKLWSCPALPDLLGSFQLSSWLLPGLLAAGWTWQGAGDQQRDPKQKHLHRTIGWKRDPKQKHLHRIIVFMSCSFCCKKGIQSGINTSGYWPCSLAQMNQVHVFLALVQSVFTNKSSLPQEALQWKSNTGFWKLLLPSDAGIV